MTHADLARMAGHNLWQRRRRTALNLIGVVIGCIILLMTSAGVGGVRGAVQTLFESSEFTRQIGVMNYGSRMGEPPEEALLVPGDMSDERRERLKKARAEEWRWQQPRDDFQLTREAVREIEQIPHVAHVTPHTHLQVTVRLDDIAVLTAASSASPRSPSLQRRIVLGESLQESEPEGILIGEYLAYRLGYQNEQDLSGIIGRDIELEYRTTGGGVSYIYNALRQTWRERSLEELADQTKFMGAFLQLLQDLDRTTLTDSQKASIRDLVGDLATSGSGSAPPELTIRRQFKIRGILQHGAEAGIADLFRSYFHDQGNAEICLLPDVAADLHFADAKQEAYSQAIVTVDRLDHLQTVSDEIKKLGAASESSEWILKHLDRGIREAQWALFAIAGVILLTSAIGISNTLIISILERTPEFGILKALGARDSDLLELMILEGGLLGVVGAAVAILLSWVLALAGHGILKWHLERTLRGEFGGFTLFQFSWPAAVVTVGVSVAICIAASLYPAWRAARLEPVAAMRRM